MIQKDTFLYKYPPQIQISQKHRLANRIFKTYTEKQSSEYCQCCNRKVGDKKTVQKSILFDTVQLAHLGPGLPLFFSFVKNSIFLLIAFIIVYGCFCLYSNKLSNNCVQNTQCQDNFIYSYSILNKQNSIYSLQMQMCFMFVFSVFSFFVLQIVKNQMKILQQKCDFFIDSPSDYSIMIRRLPQNIDQNDIRQMVDEVKKTLTYQQLQSAFNLQINHIVLSYSMKSYRQTKQKNRIQFLKAIQQKNYQNFIPENFTDFNVSGDTCIIVFQRQEAKQYFNYEPTVYQKFLNCLWSPCIPLSKFQVKGERVSLQRAPQPDDIIWQNANVQLNQAIKRKTKFNFLGLALLILGCGIQILLTMAQNSATSTVKTILSLVSSIIISLSNYGILQFLRYGSSKQKNLTHTQYNTVLTVKVSFLQFLNAGIFLIISKCIASPNSFQFSDLLVFEINTIMILNGVSHNVCTFVLDYFNITNAFQKYLGQKGFFKYTQMQHNNLHQLALPDMPYKYGYVLKTLWLTGFYSSFVPMSVFYTLVGLLLNYLIQKKLFAGSYSAPQMFSSALNQTATKLLYFFPLSITFGGLIIFVYFSQQVSGLCFVYYISSLIISLMIIFLPTDKIYQKLFKVTNQREYLFSSYKEVQNNFQLTYEMTNPAYNKKRRTQNKQKKQKVIMIGDFKQISLAENQLINNNYREVIEKHVIQYKEQKQRNQQQQVKADKQRLEHRNQLEQLYQNVSRNVLISQQQKLKLLSSPRKIKSKLLEMQNYNPITANQDTHKHKFSQNHFKNFNNPNRVKFLIGNPFTKKLSLQTTLLDKQIMTDDDESAI